MILEYLLRAEAIVLIAIALALIAFLRTTKFAELQTTNAEKIAVAKVIFIILSAMVMIMIHNSIELPAGQFIYGRF
ncbi:MAG: hypothetical protein JKX91_01440 [Rhizobiaceae bacterium]|nr:hypothetical protein [Rhizobiaceae bacterium]